MLIQNKCWSPRYHKRTVESWTVEDGTTTASGEEIESWEWKIKSKFTILLERNQGFKTTNRRIERHC